MKKFSVFVLIYTLAVILFGAYVRISGSGAGCGEHWPSCEGEVMPSDLMKNNAKAIEFTHRTTSGLSGIFVLILFLGVLRSRETSRDAKREAGFAFFLIIVEGLLGASLVLFRWVHLDQSVGRGIMMPLHLANTYLLLSALTLTTISLHYPNRVLASTKNRAVRIAGILVFATGVFGALAALGDTLFPGTKGLVTDGHTYLKLRNIHPFLAVLTIGHVIGVALRQREHYNATFLSRYNICDVILFFVAMQGILGGLNILLSAPPFMQIIHLFTSDILWISYTIWLFEPRVVSPASVSINRLT